MEFTHTFTLSDEDVDALEALRKAMSKYHLEVGSSEVTLEEAFDFAMLLGQNHLIPNRIENAAYYYDAYYDEYPYKYGKAKTKREVEQTLGKEDLNAYAM